MTSKQYQGFPMTESASAFAVSLGETAITGAPAAMIIFGVIGLIFVAGFLVGRA
jgi:hypothetical protein